MPEKKEKFANIFEAAGQTDKKAAAQKEGKIDTDFIPPLPPTPKEKQPLRSKEALDEQFKRCQEMYKELQEQTRSIADKIPFPIVELYKKIGDPTNFSSQAWQQLNEYNKVLEQRLNELQPKTVEGEEQEDAHKKPKKMTGKRRWLPM